MEGESVSLNGPTTSLFSTMDISVFDGLPMTKAWDTQILIRMTKEYKDEMECPACNGHITISGGGGNGAYQVWCARKCRMTKYSVRTWYGSFFSKHFKDLVKIDPDFYGQYLPSCNPDDIEAFLARRASRRESGATESVSVGESICDAEDMGEDENVGENEDMGEDEKDVGENEDMGEDDEDVGENEDMGKDKGKGKGKGICGQFGVMEPAEVAMSARNVSEIPVISMISMISKTYKVTEKLEFLVHQYKEQKIPADMVACLSSAIDSLLGLVDILGNSAATRVLTPMKQAPYNHNHPSTFSAVVAAYRPQTSSPVKAEAKEVKQKCPRRTHREPPNTDVILGRFLRGEKLREERRFTLIYLTGIPSGPLHLIRRTLIPLGIARVWVREIAFLNDSGTTVTELLVYKEKREEIIQKLQTRQPNGDPSIIKVLVDYDIFASLDSDELTMAKIEGVLRRLRKVRDTQREKSRHLAHKVYAAMVTKGEAVLRTLKKRSSTEEATAMQVESSEQSDQAAQ